VTALRYGRSFAADKAAAWRAQNPTNLERMIIDWLTANCYEFKREVKVEAEDVLMYPDFIITNTLTDTVIECDGEYWHSLPGAAERDKRKHAVLDARGFMVIRLSEASIMDGSAFAQLERVLV
jgi:very-short-patch-repair endonuclease